MLTNHEISLNNRIYLGTGLSASKNYDEIYNNVKVAVMAGIMSFDTAPSYKTESDLGKAINCVLEETSLCRSDVFVQTKVDPWQMQDSNGAVDIYVHESIKKMKFEYLDAVLIHWPLPEYVENTINSLSRLKSNGLINKWGVCNVRIRHLDYIKNNVNINPDIIQIERNPLRTCEKEVDYCLNEKIDIQAYSPLCKMINKIKDNNQLLDIARKYEKSIGQIILRWHIDTGVNPIFTSTKIERIKEYANIFDFKLEDVDIKRITNLNENYKIYLESWSCPGF